MQAALKGLGALDTNERIRRFISTLPYEGDEQLDHDVDCVCPGCERQKGMYPSLPSFKLFSCLDTDCIACCTSSQLQCLDSERVDAKSHQKLEPLSPMAWRRSRHMSMPSDVWGEARPGIQEKRTDVGR